MPTAEAVLLRRRWARTRAIAMAWLTIWCGLGELTINPVANIRWSGDPDGELLAGRYLPDWHWPTLVTLVALIGLCCVTTTVLLAATGTGGLWRARDNHSTTVRNERS